MGDKEEFSETLDLKKLRVKDEVNKDLWDKTEKKLKGNPEEVKEGIKIFFENYRSLPTEADDLICKYAQKDQLYEHRLLIASYFAEKGDTLSFRLYSNILNTLRKDEDKKIQELIAEKLKKQKELEQKISTLYKNIFSHIYSMSGLLQSYQAFQTYQNKIVSALLKSRKNLFRLYYTPGTLSALKVPVKAKEKYSSQLIDELRNCPKGKKGWSQYQSICKKILKYLFIPPLIGPISQSRTDNGFHIRDFILQIPTYLSGFWGYCQMKHDSVGVVVECKDYTGQVRGNDVITTSKYLNEKRCGNFGILLCREDPSPDAIHEVKRLWKEDGKFIVVITDEELIAMIKLKENDDEPQKIIEKKAFELRISLD